MTLSTTLVSRPADAFLNPLLFLSPNTPPPKIYTLSLHDALPISPERNIDADVPVPIRFADDANGRDYLHERAVQVVRSEEHTSELQSRVELVCRLLLEKKKSMCNGHRARTVRSTDARHTSNADVA